MWGRRKNWIGWTTMQLETLRWLKWSNQRCASAQRLKMALREVYSAARTSNDDTQAKSALPRWITRACSARANLDHVSTTQKQL